jgi:hypothetical protein
MAEDIKVDRAKFERTLKRLLKAKPVKNEDLKLGKPRRPAKPKK